MILPLWAFDIVWLCAPVDIGWLDYSIDSAGGAQKVRLFIGLDSVADLQRDSDTAAGGKTAVPLFGVEPRQQVC